MPQAAPFVFVTCHQNAEPALKAELATQGWRLAFSRPGFVSVKRDVQADATLPQGVFARTVSWSLGRSQAATGDALADDITKLVRDHGAPDQQPFSHLHLWSRDRLPVGDKGFTPGPEPLTRAVAQDLAPRLQTAGVLGPGQPNQVAVVGDRVLDVVLTDPGQWMIGWHDASTHAPSRWPGGCPPIDFDADVVSRAYFKAAEAILWSGFAMAPNETVVEVGSAPGGASQRLLEMGLHVIGIDPAEMDPEVAEHPSFEHIQARGGDLKRNVYRNARWLLVDSNVRPDKTLVTVENIVTNNQVNIHGMLLTLKIGRYDQADRIQGWCRTIRKWGYADIAVRQLTTGRCEVCVAAQKTPA